MNLINYFLEYKKIGPFNYFIKFPKTLQTIEFSNRASIL